tara:strand:- start:253 stop:1632 length:1380 start_codon:yes stop_codon:yes gene_type:complete
MASIRQDYLGNYSQQNQNVGIGTSIPKEKLEIHGGITAQQDLNVTGIATLTVASGFIKRNLEYSEDVYISSGDSATLSGEIIIGAGLTMTVGTGATAGQGNIDSLKVYDMFQPPSGTTNQRPVGKPGSLFYNFDFKTVEFFDGNSWRQVDNTTTRGRGFFVGGGASGTPTGTDIHEYIEIATLGNAIDFGNLAQGGIRMFGACGSATRGLLGGGYKPAASPTAVVDIIEYFTMASSGNTIDFGNLSDARGEVNACSSSTRGMWVAGEDVPFADMNILDYVEIATLGNALDFGDLTEDVRDPQAFASPVRGVRSGGNDNTDSDISETIDFWKFASKGNAIRFGDLIARLSGPGNCSSNIRGFMLGGNSPSKINFIQSITIASEGNATFFGDLSFQDATNACGTSNSTRGIKAGGATPSLTNVIEFFNMSTAGSSQDFGDLSIPRNNSGSTSDSHGGLGGF